ncbi:AI-2E family transporter [Pinibacter aurantiacus]|uniref:AI-2E family transporter n=1 Tax=Pinibacter aurantiacus TaxID=2851599 RepID=A0A9E2W8G5_9BACT|nr:AI-2E family transporter [Pinibacter aurantiacus]MBV4358157.1 AI-2E family transporter [Pinibacter aurantiacus]
MDMSNDTSRPVKSVSTSQLFNTIIQLLLVALLISWCFRILSPFINPIAWAAILAVVLYPAHQKLTKKLKGKSTRAAVIITVLLLCILIVPAVWLSFTTADEIKEFVADYRAGNVQLPPPRENVKGWPFIGDKAHELWVQASQGLDTIVKKYPKQTRSALTSIIGLLASTAKGLLLFTFSIIISGVFLSYSEATGRFAKNLFNRLMGSNSTIDVTSIVVVTIRNVVKGILGVAFIQTILAAIGLVLAGVPAAGLWTLLCLILAIIQIGILPISICIIVYIWSTGTTLTATLLTIWLLLVGLSDNVLKPLLLGKGAPVPMLVVFLGAVGGFVLSGFMGLFTGAVVMSLGYKLFTLWLEGENNRITE